MSSQSLPGQTMSPPPPPPPPKKDETSTNQAVIVGGVLGSLIVLVLIAIFVALIKLVWKRRGHTQPVEGRRFHNRDMINTTYTHREPSPYECPARQPQDHDYAELEREHPHDSSQHQDLVHLYEEADKYFRGMNDEDFVNSGYHLTGEGVNGKRPQFQCIITPPPEDDYANPDDAVINNIQEISTMDNQQTYAVLEENIITGSESVGDEVKETMPSCLHRQCYIDSREESHNSSSSPASCND